MRLYPFSKLMKSLTCTYRAWTAWDLRVVSDCVRDSCWCCTTVVIVAFGCMWAVVSVRLELPRTCLAWFVSLVQFKECIQQSSTILTRWRPRSVRMAVCIVWPEARCVSVSFVYWVFWFFASPREVALYSLCVSLSVVHRMYFVVEASGKVDLRTLRCSNSVVKQLDCCLIRLDVLTVWYTAFSSKRFFCSHAVFLMLGCSLVRCLVVAVRSTQGRSFVCFMHNFSCCRLLWWFLGRSNKFCLLTFTFWSFKSRLSIICDHVSCQWLLRNVVCRYLARVSLIVSLSCWCAVHVRVLSVCLTKVRQHIMLRCIGYYSWCDSPSLSFQLLLSLISASLICSWFTVILFVLMT